MWRWLAVAALGAALLTTPAWGQRGGGHGGGFGGGHAGFGGGVHGGFGGGVHSGLSSRGFGGHPGFGAGRPFGHPGFGSRPFGFRNRYRGWGWGWPYWGWGWPGYEYDNYSSNYYPSQGYADNYDARDPKIAQEQQAEIDRLNDEVARLRDQRESHNTSLSASSSEKTELVFNDKHSEEIQNYAIIGPTLWVLNSDKSRKIPLAELNIPATQKVNDDRGVDFQLPR